MCKRSYVGLPLYLQPIENTCKMASFCAKMCKGNKPLSFKPLHMTMELCTEKSLNTNLPSKVFFLPFGGKLR